MAVQCLDVVMDGVGAKPHLDGDLLFAESGKQVFQRLPLAGREVRRPVSGHQHVTLVDPAHLDVGQVKDHAVAGAEGGGAIGGPIEARSFIRPLCGGRGRTPRRVGPA